ncbi:MAG TPA: response regulator [Opitutaceae bacterium]|nr:response regulator [Opitutaceae bacterium]
MNLVKKILIVHGEPRMKRRLVLMLADAGYDLRSFTSMEPALETARTEWFDVALIDSEISGEKEFENIAALKKIQPTVPVIVVVPQLELSQIVKGMRMGLSDVLPTANDLRPLLRRVNSLLRVAPSNAAEDQSLSPSELAEAEAVLQVLGNPEPVHSSDPFNDADLRQELMRHAKEHAALATKTERLEHEKAALQAELKTLLTQNEDALKLQAEFAELNTQREVAAAAQALIEQKSTALAEARSQLARERTLLEEERRNLEITTQNASTQNKTPDEIVRERAELDQNRARLLAEEFRLREENTRIQQQTTQLAQERRRWHEDLDLLREQENNLREYEARLRQLQAQLEADRVLWFSSRPQTRSPFHDDAAVKAAWEKLQRATDLLEAERAVFRDERMALRELDADIKRREAKLEENANRLAEQEKRLRGLPPASSHSTSPLPQSATPSQSVVKALSRAPFEMAKSLLGRGKSDEG